MHMRIPKISFRLMAGVLLLVLAAYGIGRYHARRTTPQAASDPVEVPSAAAAQIYTCSMHPQVRTPDPDEKCPICAMDLIPVPSDGENLDEDTGTPQLRISQRAAALMQLRTWPAERRDIARSMSLFGTIQRDENRVYKIVARTDAYVENLFARTPWQTVEKGDPIAALYSPDAVTAMREWRIAEQTGAAGVAMREAAAARLIRMGLDPAAIAALAGPEDMPRTFQVISPVAGVIQTLATREGDWLREGQPLLEIVDLAHVWINLEAYEHDLPWLREGNVTTITVAALPGLALEGTITFIDPVVDPVKRTVQLRVEVQNPDQQLKPGMYVSAVIEGAPAALADGQPPLVVPASAPLVMGHRALLYVQLPDTERPTFEPREVELGPRTDAWWIITAGLDEGELVVVNGQFKIDSELQIRGRPSMMAPAGDGAPVHDHGEHADHAMPDNRQLQTQCPVMGGAINPEHFIDVEGYRIYVCCPGCDQQIAAHPQKYIREMEQAGVQLYRLQTHCPIMGGAINRELYHDHDGQRIYVCCAGCLEEVRQRSDEIITEQRRQGIVFESVP